jgi:hypothetical protein
VQRKVIKNSIKIGADLRRNFDSGHS